MKIPVTGATGYVGGRLVPLLLDRGHEVRTTTSDLRPFEPSVCGVGLEQRTIAQLVGSSHVEMTRGTGVLQVAIGWTMERRAQYDDGRGHGVKDELDLASRHEVLRHLRFCDVRDDPGQVNDGGGDDRPALAKVIDAAKDVLPDL